MDRAFQMENIKIFPRGFLTSFISFTLVFIVKRSMCSWIHSEVLPAGCDGDPIKEEGIILSPDFSLNFTRNMACTWKLTVPENYNVAVGFAMYWLKSYDNCTYNHLEVRDGHLSTDPIIFKLCEDVYWRDIRSSGNKMLLKFVADESTSTKGFPIMFYTVSDPCKSDHGCQFECINTPEGKKCICPDQHTLQPDGKTCDVPCGGVIEEMNGVITSPLFPGQYPPNKKCTWEIIASPQNRITLYFMHFDLEQYKNDCKYDNLTITSKLDGNEVKNHGNFCGPNLPPVITSESNILRIEFNSDQSAQHSGFKAHFFSDVHQCATNNGGCQHICQNTKIGSYNCSCNDGFVLHDNFYDCIEEKCEYIIINSDGKIGSWNNLNHYPNEKECSWLLKTRPGHRINLFIEKYIQQPDYEQCAHDNPMVYDGDTSKDKLIDRFCGGMLTSFDSSSNRLLVKFKSDSSIEGNYFIARHTSVCGDSMMATENERHIYSHPQFGEEDYMGNQNCDWYISGMDSRRIRLRFLSFDLEEPFANIRCDDYVEVVDGYVGKEVKNNYKKKTFCGNQNLPEIITTGPSLSLHFRTDRTISSRGFHAAFSVVYQNISVTGAFQNTSEINGVTNYSEV